MKAIDHALIATALLMVYHISESDELMAVFFAALYSVALVIKAGQEKLW